MIFDDEQLEKVIDRAVAAGIERYQSRFGAVRLHAYTIGEAATALRTSEPTIRKLIEQGHLPVVPHMGRRKVIPVAAIEALATTEWHPPTPVPAAPAA